MNNSIGFSYGGMSEPIIKQAEEQGYTLNLSDHLESLRKSILMLSINGYIPESQTKKCFDRLHKNVVKNLEKIK